MMKKIIIFGLIILAVFLVGCQKEITCSGLGGTSVLFDQDCPVGTTATKLKDVCKSCTCCVPDKNLDQIPDDYWHPKEYDVPEHEQVIVGGDKDEHGCLIAAGYRWCPSTEKCQRMWGEYCEEYADEFNIDSFEDCVAAGYPVMESYPRQCSDGSNTYVEEIEQEGLSMEEAKVIAESSACMDEGSLKETYFYNENTKTWWFDLDAEKEGCNPACVVSEETRSAEINWRCTGLLP